MKISHALAVLVFGAVFALSGCTLEELSHPRLTLAQAAYPAGPPQVVENPATRNAFYGGMPRDVTLEWVLSGHENESRTSVESRLQRIESLTKSQLQSKGYNVRGVLHGGSSTDPEIVRVQVDYETCPTLAVGGRGRDHSVIVTCIQGEDVLGTCTCRWIDSEAADIDGLLDTLATKAAATIPAAVKAERSPSAEPATAPGA